MRSSLFGTQKVMGVSVEEDKKDPSVHHNGKGLTIQQNRSPGSPPKQLSHTEGNTYDLRLMRSIHMQQLTTLLGLAADRDLTALVSLWGEIASCSFAFGWYWGGWRCRDSYHRH